MDTTKFCYPEDIDRLLTWALGTASRLARRRKLPHYRLPDGAIRFSKDEIQALVHHVPPVAGWEGGAPIHTAGPAVGAVSR